jgi:hypothetical protein
MNLSVDWIWVKANIDLILEDPDAAYALLDAAGLTSIQVNGSQFTLDLNLSIADLRNLFPSNQTTFNATLFSILLQDTVELALGNETSIVLFRNISVDSNVLKQFVFAVSKNVIAPLDGAALNSSLVINGVQLASNILSSSPQLWTIEYEGLEYNRSSQILTLLNVTISNKNNISATVNRFNLPLSVILNRFPNGTVSYVLNVSSQITTLHNSSSPHAGVIMNAEVLSSLFERCSPAASSAGATPSYVARNHPLPITYQQSLEIQVILSLFAAILSLIPLCYLPASFVTFIVRERMSKSKHLQIVSSVSPYTYWNATYIWDLTLYLLLVGCIMAALFSYQGSAAKVFIGSSESALTIFVLLIVYGSSCIPLCYLYSFAFENHATAQISIMVFNFLTGFVAVLAYFIMVNIPSTKALGERLVHFFRFFPT